MSGHGIRPRSSRPRVRSVLLLCWRDTGHPQGGGSETYLQRIGAHLAESGVRVTLRTARYPGAARREVLDGVQISRAGGRYSVYIWAGLPRVAVLSRLVPHKQIEDALDAIAELRPRIPDVHLDILGGGWWEKRLVDHAELLGISDAVTFHGHVDDSPKHHVLQQCWVHILPSRKEGWGLAVTEAAQHGVPTIGYRSSGGLTDSIVDGVTGLLVNDHAGLVDELERLLTDHLLREQLGAKAAIRSGEFSWPQSADAMRAVLESVHARRMVSVVVQPAAVADPTQTDHR